MKEFETERLVVRRLRPDGLDNFAALTGDPEVVRYMDKGRPLSRDLTRTWIEVSEANYRTRGYGCFAVTEKPDDRMIGFCGVAFPSDRPGIVEVIYALSPSLLGARLRDRSRPGDHRVRAGSVWIGPDRGNRRPGHRGVEAAAGEGWDVLSGAR